VISAEIANLQPPAGQSEARSALRRAADELVGEVFYGTLLRQMRQSPLKGAYGHGGRGEEVFQGQLDTVLASQAGRARGGEIADALVERFARRAEAAAEYRKTLRTRIDEMQESILAPMAEGQVGV
jgi:Rod binding domain-containing protein